MQDCLTGGRPSLGEHKQTTRTYLEMLRYSVHNNGSNNNIEECDDLTKIKSLKLMILYLLSLVTEAGISKIDFM